MGMKVFINSEFLLQTLEVLFYLFLFPELEGKEGLWRWHVWSQWEGRASDKVSVNLLAVLHITPDALC